MHLLDVGTWSLEPPETTLLGKLASPWLARRTRAQGDPVASRSTELAQRRRHFLADDRRDARRPDERARPGRALRRRDAEALVDQQHDADLRLVRDRADHLGAVGVQDGLRLAFPRALAPRLLREL